MVYAEGHSRFFLIRAGGKRLSSFDSEGECLRWRTGAD